MQRLYKTDIVALKKILVERGIDTITELSAVLGVNYNTLTLIFNGKIQPSAYVMERLVKALHISPENAGKIFFSQYLRIA